MEEQLTFPDGLKPVLPNVFLSRVTRFIDDNDLKDISEDIYDELEAAVDFLAETNTLPPEYKLHLLVKQPWLGYLEFHLFYDILIIAKYNNRQNTFKFLWIKTHEELHDGNIE